MATARTARGLAVACALLVAAPVGCAWRTAGETGLCRQRTLRTRPFAASRVYAGDVEGLAYVADDDALWISDDNARALYLVDRRSGAFRARLREQDILAAFPDASACDDGDGDPATACSYTGALETVAYDPQSLSLYVFNTASFPPKQPPPGKPAVYLLRKPRSGENFRFQSWQEPPWLLGYDGVVAIDGQLWVTTGNGLVRYDFADNRILDLGADGKPAPALRTSHGSVVDAAHGGGSLWLLTANAKLVQLRWPDGVEEAVWDLAPFGISKPKGLAVGGEEIFVVDGNPPNPIHVLRFAAAPGFSRASWLGGWPSSCP